MKRQQISAVLFIALGMMGMEATAQMCPYPADDCNACVAINLPPSPTICAGASYSLNLATYMSVPTTPAGMSIASWTWSPATVSPAAGTFPSLPGITVFTPTVTTSYGLSVVALGPNMVNKGDFTAFTPTMPCFYTDYTYYAPGTSMYASELYAVGTNPAPYTGSGFFQPMGDHTTGTGNMMIVNGSTSTSPIKVVWEENQVPVCPGQTYQFTMWYANIDPGGGGFQTADLRVVINGTSYAPYTPTSLGVWYPVNITWTAPVGTTMARLQIFDDDTWDNYNDFAIDDISFRRVCQASAKFTIFVDNVSIEGADKVCAGNTISLTATPAGGTWSSGGPGATVDASGIVTGVTAGTTTISYTSPTGCVATKVITVNPNPIVISGGPGTVCNGQVLSLTATPPGGTWSTTPELASTGGAPGSYYGAINGVGTVTYTQGGCYATRNITVNPTPNYIPAMYKCIGDAVTLSTTPTGGTWTCSPAGVAVITPGGSLTCTGAGLATITYTLPTGCSTTSNLFSYNCDSGVIVAPTNLCQGSHYTFIGLPAGGTWSSSDPSIVSIDAVTGAATAVSGGVVTITYTVGGIVKTITVFVNAPVTATAAEVVVGGIPYVNFTSTCSSPGATIYYNIYDISWHPLGHTSSYPYSASPSMLPYSTLYGFPGCSMAYYICVVGVSCNGCYWSQNGCFNLNDPNWHFKPSGIITSDYASLSIVPNPNEGVFSIRGAIQNSGSNNEVAIEIIDMMGKTLSSEMANVNNGQIDKVITLDGNIANGTYLIRIKTDATNQVLRFIVNR